MTVLKYCYCCHCVRKQLVCPPHYSVTPKYKCLHCGRINADSALCKVIPATWK